MNRVRAMKKESGLNLLIFVLFLSTALFLSFAMAQPVLSEEEIKGSAKQGRYLFRAKCKECHWPDEEGGDVTPVTYTKAQWTRFFDKGKYKRKMDITGQFTPEELTHIQTYLIKHASDSEQPETCG